MSRDALHGHRKHCQIASLVVRSTAVPTRGLARRYGYNQSKWRGESYAISEQ